MPKLLIIAGLLLVAADVLSAVAERFGITRRPSDVVIERENFRVYIPITSSIVLSILLSFGFWLFRRQGGERVAVFLMRAGKGDDVARPVLVSERCHTFFRHRAKKFRVSLFVALERIVPYDRRAGGVDDFESPVLFIFEADNVNLLHHAVFGEIAG